MSYEMTDEEKVKFAQAYAAIRSGFNIYTRALGINDVTIQPGLVVCVAASWILDESRHIEFHPCNDIKRYKRASYFAYWFTWIKPIQVISEELRPSADLALINERFALFMAYRMLGISAVGVVPNDFTEEMLYVLRYRNSTPESLFTTMSLLEISAKSGELRKTYPQKVDAGESK
jgi:hypothetical protein